MKKLLLLSALGMFPALAFGVIGADGQTGGSDTFRNATDSAVLMTLNQIKDIQQTGASLGKELADAYVKKISVKLSPEQAKAFTNVVEALINKIDEKGGLVASLKEKFGQQINLSERAGKVGSQKTVGAILELTPANEQLLGVEGIKSIDLTKNEDKLKLLASALKVIHAQLEVLPENVSATELTNIIFPSANAVLSQKNLEIEGKKQTGLPTKIGPVGN